MPLLRKSEEDKKRHEKLGETMEKILVRDYIDFVMSSKRLITYSFLRGVFMGLGTVIGATIVVSLLIYIFNAFGALPVIGDYFNRASTTIEEEVPGE